MKLKNHGVVKQAQFQHRNLSIISWMLVNLPAEPIWSSVFTDVIITLKISAKIRDKVWDSFGAFMVAQRARNLPAVQETQVQ